jgi:hypothetical protein
VTESIRGTSKRPNHTSHNASVAAAANLPAAAARERLRPLDTGTSCCIHQIQNRTKVAGGATIPPDVAPPYFPHVQAVSLFRLQDRKGLGHPGRPPRRCSTPLILFSQVWPHGRKLNSMPSELHDLKDVVRMRVCSHYNRLVSLDYLQPHYVAGVPLISLCATGSKVCLGHP